MWETLIGKLQTTLENADLNADVFSVPKSKLSKYPSIYFTPDSYISRFETNNQNFKIYRFYIAITVGGSQLSIDRLFNEVLPRAVDKVNAKIDEDWDQGTTVDGHRIWVKVESADPWSYSEEQDGLQATAPIYCEFRALESN